MIEEIQEWFEEANMFAIGMGLATAVLIFLLRKQMLNPFLIHMGTVEGIFWGGLTYIGSAVMGYLVGIKLSDS